MVALNAESDFLNYADTQLVPSLDGILIERHRPIAFAIPYHHHASIELNYLDGCDMEYSFSGTSVVRRSGSLTLFWGASPHGVTRVDGDGEIINIYVSFSQILRWGLPEPFLNSLIAGDVMSAAAQPDTDPRSSDAGLRKSRAVTPPGANWCWAKWRCASGALPWRAGRR